MGFHSLAMTYLPVPMDGGVEDATIKLIYHTTQSELSRY